MEEALNLSSDRLLDDDDDDDDDDDLVFTFDTLFRCSDGVHILCTQVLSI